MAFSGASASVLTSTPASVSAFFTAFLIALEVKVAPLTLSTSMDCVSTISFGMRSCTTVPMFSVSLDETT